MRIGTFSSVAVHWAPPVIKRFQHDYPGIDYEPLTGEYSRIEQWIMDGRVDLGFVFAACETGAVDGISISG